MALHASSLHLSYLKEAYGIKYSEAFYCYPRRFNLNLKNEITARLAAQHVDLEFEIIAWLTFQEIPSLNHQPCLYNVSLCANFLCTTFQFNNINPMNEYTVDEVYEKALVLITQLLPIESFRARPKTPAVRRYACNLDLPTIAGKSSNSKLDIEQLKLDLINRNNARQSLVSSKCYHRLNSFEVTKENLVEANTDEQVNLEKKLEKILYEKKAECILCFDSLFDLNDCTILNSCANVICNQCMRDYVHSSLLNMLHTAGRMQCPGCEQEMELALMINYACNGQLMDTFTRLIVERITFVLNDYKWCPEPSCGKIMQIDLHSNPYGTVSCSCGFKMCLKCNNPPHFPAKCSQIANYYTKLKANDDYNVVEEEPIYHSMGRRCPNCKTFMEKNGGCNHMYCSFCKKYFCWGCGAKYETHKNGACQNFNKNTSVVLTFKKERKTKSKATGKSDVKYESAVKHRQKQTTKEKAIMQKKANRFFNSIKLSTLSIEMDDERKKFYSETELAVHENKLKAEKKNEIKRFLEQLVLFLNEMHFVCEHAFILLKDASLEKDKRVLISNTVKNMEVVICLIEESMEHGKGLVVVDTLRTLYTRGLNCIKKLRNYQME